MSLLPLDPSKLRLLAVAAAACLGGCGGSEVIVESTFPRPLIEPLPVSMGIVIPDELYNFIYTEDIPDQSLWTIALGDANVAMLEPLFEGMFRETQRPRLARFGGRRQTLDGVIEPQAREVRVRRADGRARRVRRGLAAVSDHGLRARRRDGHSMARVGLRQVRAASRPGRRRAARRHRGHARSRRDDLHEVQ